MNATDERDEWTLQKDEFALLPGPTDKGCLGFAIQIKFRQIHGRYPESLDDIDPVAVQRVSEQGVVQYRQNTVSGYPMPQRRHHYRASGLVHWPSAAAHQ